MDSARLVVMGASLGGVVALQAIAKGLAADFPAPILVVQHVGAHPSILPRLLSRAGALEATHAVDGEKIVAGRIVLAPPDHHLLVEDGVMRVHRGAKEHHSRPAIDPLFRSAALTYGPAVIGVVLTGSLDDGTEGLQAIKRCGGIAVVQDPRDAEAPSMPNSALRYVDVDHQVPLAEMANLLLSLVTAKEQRATSVKKPEALVHEQELFLAKGDPMEHLTAIGKPSTFVCPDCKGSLWEVVDSQPLRLVCHTGHGFSLRSMESAQSEATDQALWSGIRALQEKSLLLKELAAAHRRESDAGEAQRLDDAADKAQGDADALRRVIEHLSDTGA